jgi:hypothetical protein
MHEVIKSTSRLNSGFFIYPDCPKKAARIKSAGPNNEPTGNSRRAANRPGSPAKGNNKRWHCGASADRPGKTPEPNERRLRLRGC